MALVPFAPPDTQRRWQQEFASPSVLSPASAPGVDKHAFIDTLASANREVPSAPRAAAPPRPPTTRFVVAAALALARASSPPSSLRGAAARSGMRCARTHRGPPPGGRSST
jgi:hypothetical protein